ncbi:type II toxin-antitoxin system HipA family toxin [Nocardia callitridis]
MTGVSDFTRQGALRFAVPDSDLFLDPDSEVPRAIELPALLRASEHVARDDGFDDVKMLLAAGTATLGGARPKASVRDGDRLCIAKFPHHADRWDVMAWEKTVLDLAENAGISVPVRSLQRVDGKGVLILERFDRDSGTRIGYISAMTMLQARDGQSVDYLDLAEAIPERAARPNADLAQLWRRIAFNIAVHNTDDHLRNHGFLRGDAGWLLAPAFDVNPNPELAEQRVTSIGGASDPAEELDALLKAADAFGLSVERARAALGEVFAATERWEAAAAANGISAAERNRFRSVFEGPRALVARLVVRNR